MTVYCPSCGLPMDRLDGYWRCPACGGEWLPGEDGEEVRAKAFYNAIRKIERWSIGKGYTFILPLDGARARGGGSKSGRRKKKPPRKIILGFET